MPICSALTGAIAKSCDTNTGGIKKMYIADFGNVTAITTSGTPAKISAITMAAATKFYDFAFNRNTSSFEEVVNVNLENGSTFFGQTVSLELARRETAKRDAIEKLVAGQKQLMVIVLDSNGIYWLFGKAEGAYATEITGGSGVAKADKNGYSIKLTAEEPAQAFEVDSTIISAIITAA
jgi:hypothetical protein